VADSKKRTDTINYIINKQGRFEPFEPESAYLSHDFVNPRLSLLWYVGEAITWELGDVSAGGVVLVLGELDEVEVPEAVGLGVPDFCESHETILVWRIDDVGPLVTSCGDEGEFWNGSPCDEEGVEERRLDSVERFPDVLSLVVELLSDTDDSFDVGVEAVEVEDGDGCHVACGECHDGVIMIPPVLVFFVYDLEPVA